MIDELEKLVFDINQFNEKHDLTTDGQFKQLCEEIGEYAEASNRDEDVSRLVEEAGDIAFVSISLMLLESDKNTEVNSMTNVMCMLFGIIDENLDKDESTEGDKVTKE